MIILKSGGDFVYYNNDSSFEVVKAKSRSAVFLDGSKLPHAGKYFIIHRDNDNEILLTNISII